MLFYQFLFQALDIATNIMDFLNKAKKGLDMANEYKKKAENLRDQIPQEIRDGIESVAVEKIINSHDSGISMTSADSPMAPAEEIGKSSADGESTDGMSIAQDDQTEMVTGSLDPMEPSHLTTYVIPEGTILYHGSKTIREFNVQRINVGDDNFVAFFTPNKSIASSYIRDCAPTGDEGGVVNGYIHEFVVKKDVTNIFIISSHDKELQWQLKKLKTGYCETTKYDIKLNGIGFFVPAKEQSKFTELSMNVPADLHFSQFALCNPAEYLKYLGTYQCTGPSQLSPSKINFDSNEIDN